MGALYRSAGGWFLARPAFEDEAVQADRGSEGAASISGSAAGPRYGTGRGGGGEETPPTHYAGVTATTTPRSAAGETAAETRTAAARATRPARYADASSNG